MVLAHQLAVGQHHVLGPGGGLQVGLGSGELALEEANGLAVEGGDEGGPLAFEGANDFVVVAQAAAFFGDLGFQVLVLLEELLVGRELGRLIEHVASGCSGIGELLAQVDHLALGGLAGPFH